MMFNRYLLPICLTVTTVLVAPHQVDAAREARAILAREVGSIAKRTVVRIESGDGGFGSGVIIGRSEKGNKNIYTVLTAAHVVRSNDTNYRIVTPVPLNSAEEKKRIIVNVEGQQNITTLPNVDLAVISFESNHTFAIGTLGNSELADEGSPVYVAGFPKPGKAIKRIALQFTGGMISSRFDESDSPKDRNNGYDLSYTNITRVGMSGGPVLDAAGRIVGIHGQGDRNNQLPGDEASSGVVGDEKTGFNLGIPIQTFLKLQPRSNTIVGARVDKSPVNYRLSDNSLTIGTNNKKFIQKLKIRSEITPIFDVTKVKETYD